MNPPVETNLFVPVAKTKKLISAGDSCKIVYAPMKRKRKPQSMCNYRPRRSR
ncbi:unnamed protein product, partial [Trichogramma brassicae]